MTMETTFTQVRIEPEMVKAALEAPVITQRPVAAGLLCAIRELQMSDAPALFALLSTEEVARFITPPPTTVAGFEKFIAWAQAEGAAGRFKCYAVVPHDRDYAIGIFQVRMLDESSRVAEWGFAIGSAFWGTGIFSDAAKIVLEYAFDMLDLRRLEARASIENARGNGALRKVGATLEGRLRRSFLRDGRWHDQFLWSIVKDDWRQTKAVWTETVH
jgi:ribosomal-protein-alanine N-acetyltransferase